jgi:ribA/ribD-fused uncharacterized protein
MVNKIDNFSGLYRFLSNFYPATVVFDHDEYPSSEAAYQAAKTFSQEIRNEFRLLTPGQAKRFGRMIQVRKDWEEVKYGIMYDIVLDKFTRHDHLKKMLLDTGNAYLEEGNTWGDTYWGVCEGVGQNKLGLILMKVRKKLLNEQQL